VAAVAHGAPRRGDELQPRASARTGRRAILQTLYTSIIDRTLIVLWRAVIFAVPAGAVDLAHLEHPLRRRSSLATWIVDSLDPVGMLIGLNG
jgi:ferrous iron transport protein B